MGATYTGERGVKGPSGEGKARDVPGQSHLENGAELRRRGAAWHRPRGRAPDLALLQVGQRAGRLGSGAARGGSNASGHLATGNLRLRLRLLDARHFLHRVARGSAK